MDGQTRTRRGSQAAADYSQRGKELDALLEIRLRDPYARLILFVLDSMLGSNWNYIDKTPEEVAEFCEMARATFYDRIGKLQDAGLLSIETIPGSPKQRWRIGRGTLLEEGAKHKFRRLNKKSIDHWERPKTSRRRSARNGDSVYLSDNTVQERDDSVQEMDNTVQQLDKPVQEMDDTIYPLRSRSQHAPFSLPSRKAVQEMDASGYATRIEGGRKEGLICWLSECGLRWATQLVEKALSRGCSIEELEEITAYWEEVREQHGWEAAALGLRLTSASPGVPADKGNWPRPKAQPAAPKPDWTALVDQVQKLTDREALALGSRDATVRAMMQQGGNWRHSEDICRLLARQLDRLRQEKADAQTKPGGSHPAQRGADALVR